MSKKLWVHWLTVIIIFGGIVMGFIIKGNVVKNDKERMELLHGDVMKDVIEQCGRVIKSYADNRVENIEITKRINERKRFELSFVPEWMQESFDYETYYADLTEEETEFLREHVFGQWRFSKRIFTNGRGEEYNFSEQGIEDMKNIVVSFDADRVNIVSGLKQETFTNSQDIYVFAEYGGFTTTDSPVYYIKKDINTHAVPLYTDFGTINFSEKKELVLVRYDLGYWESNWRKPAAGGDNGYPCSYLAEYLYIDPEDTDTLYMSFGGLWELKRDSGTYHAESDASLLSGRSDEKWEYDLTEEDMEFLEKHLFGQWEFSKRLIALDEGKENISNFSDFGMEELKEIRFTYEVRSVRPIFLRKFFTDVKDMYLFGIYGGLNIVDLPYYHIDTDVDENNICLTDIYGTGNCFVQFPKEKELVRVYYNLGYDETNNPSINGIYMGSNIYIDPDDTNTIYLDFGGLWEMKRDEQNYDTNGKQKY